MENSGGWKTYRKFGEKPLPRNVFGPPTYDTFSPPFLATLCHFPLKKEAPTRPTPISEASKSGFGEHTLQYVSPPPKFTQYVLSPPSAAAQLTCSVWGLTCRSLLLRLKCPQDDIVIHNHRPLSDASREDGQWHPSFLIGL